MSDDKKHSPETIRETAFDALLTVASNGAASASARAAAGRTLLEAIGVIGRNQDLGRVADVREASEMTPAEINDEIARLSKKIPAVRAKRLKLPGT